MEKKTPRVFLTRSKNEEDVDAFLSPMHHGFVSEPATAGLSVEMSDSSNISSGSRVPVEVAKSWPFSTVIDSLVNLLFPFPSFSHPARTQ